MAPYIPVLLLKTKSSPGDAYQDVFSASQHNGLSFAPEFVPVLQHTFLDAGMEQVEALLRERRIGTGPEAEYGGLIFTSQRAVEAFVKLVQDGKQEALSRQDPDADRCWPLLQDVPVYSVGPATTRALAAVPQSPGPLHIFGGHAGNGAALAQFMLDHYGEWYADRPRKPPLLFLVGETRRDVIPRTLMDPALPAERRVSVVETVVYGTEEMASFPADIARVLGGETQEPGQAARWVVVFSPTGCDSLLRTLGVLDPDTGRVRPGVGDGDGDGTTFVATIGPTTRDHLRSFGFEPHVCAETPTPEGVRDGIVKFMTRNQASN